MTNGPFGHRGPKLLKRSRCGLYVLILSVVSAGCVTPFGTLEGVVVDDEAVGGAELSSVRIIREGRAVPAELNMILLKNDEIITASDTRAVIHVLDEAYEVTIGADTEITLRNPSIFVKIGEIFLVVRKRLEEIREKLEAEHEFATAGPESTEFLFAVNTARELKVAVVEGAILVSPRGESNWAPVLYRTREQGVVRGPLPPERMPDLSIEEADSLADWAREVDRLTAIDIPSVTGMQEREALARLAEQNLVPGRVQHRITGEFEAGTVISQEPAPGTTQRIGDTVDLVIEDGVRVPSLTGATRAESERRLRAVGMRVGEITEERSDRRAGVVIEQTPAAGTLARRNDTVDLVLARGCVVPDLDQLSEREARVRLGEEDLQLGQVLRLELGNTVTQQDPEEGTRVECGATVDITIGVVG